MFTTLLAVTFVTATLVSLIVAKVFRKPIDRLLDRIVGSDMSAPWSRYLTFAIYVVGISGGVRVWALERYIVPDKETGEMLTLNADRWTLEIYQTIMGALQAVAWMLLVFFLFALVAYVIVKVRESSAADG
jgi:hypothetical protein